MIIDDNSYPEYKNIEYIKTLKTNVTIIFTKNGKGAGFARNIGLKEASGKWIIFADADDFFIDNFLYFLDKYLDSKYDLIYFGIKAVYANTNIIHEMQLNFEKEMQKAITTQNYDHYKYTTCVLWGKLIRSSIIKNNNIFLDETPVANDRMFSIKTAYYANNIFFDKNKIYNYNIYNNRKTLTSSKNLNINYYRLLVYINTNNYLKLIYKKKYRKNILKSVIFLFDFKDITYFRKVFKLLKGNYFFLLKEIFKGLIFFPFFIIQFLFKKIKNKITKSKLKKLN